MKVYFDANAVDLTENHWEAAEFDAMLASQDVTLSVGLHLIYELARGFLIEGKFEKIRRLFNFLNQLGNPYYVPPTDELLRNELLKVTTGAFHLAIMNEENRRRVKEEIWRMACGSTEVAEKFIKDRESKVKKEVPRVAEEVIRRVDELRTANPNFRRIPGSFAAFKESLDLETKLATIRLQFDDMGLIVFEHDLRRMLLNPNDYLVINTWLNCGLYLNWIPARYQDSPSLDKFDDFRHVIDCCTSDIFVTDDGELIARFPDLNPFVKCIPWSQFKSKLEGNNLNE